MGELIDKLKELPPDAPVFVNGYEGGIADLERVEHVFVKRDVNSEWWDGRHEAFDPANSYYAAKYGKPDCEGYVLPR